ncbi:MAG: hypothetical protein WBZ36_08125 [Candidatus Nitrosopolaris sp.]
MSDPIPKPKLSLFRYSWLASTYRPPELGPAEIQILDLFAKSDSQSAYGILKELKTMAKVTRRESSPAYKDVHKRVKRLLQLKLIYQTENHFERGAKHYRITPSGLITTLDKNIGPRYLTTRDNYEREYAHIIYNTHNPVIQLLLYELFEQRTINHFPELPTFLAGDLNRYLHECCSYTTDVCRNSGFWYNTQRYKITDILPSDDILQKYMAHIAGEPVEEHVLDAIKEYEERLKKRLDENDVKDKELATRVEEYNSTWEGGKIEGPFSYRDEIVEKVDCLPKKPPFPLLHIYDIVFNLDAMLEVKTRSFISNFIIKMGEGIKEGEWGTDVNDEDSEINRHALYYLVTDKRFMGLVNAFKSVFDTGCKHLIDAGK